MVIDGIVINEPIPKPQINYTCGNLVILGGGRNVWDDLKAYKELFSKFDVMAVNDIAFQFSSEINHAVSLHPEFLQAIRILRPINSLGAFSTHSNKMKNGVTFSWDIPNVGGTSSLFACKIALLMGYEKIVLCGVPLDTSGHYFDPPEGDNQNNHGYHEQTFVWQDFKRDALKSSRVKSMSGRTKKILGYPTEEWIKE